MLPSFICFPFLCFQSFRNSESQQSSGEEEEALALMASSSSPPRNSEGNANKERNRTFDAKTRTMCWEKADVVPGRHPERWRKDAAGNVLCKRFWNCTGCLCYEYDHIIPFSKGGKSTVENCQILQARVNRLKSDKDGLEKTELASFSCDVKFTVQ